jgi:predicted RNA methylase
MLQLAQVGPDDVVYDLGAGDGRVVIQAAEMFGATGVGVEYDPVVAQRGIDMVNSRALQQKVKIIVGDALKVDVSPATVVTVYLLQDTMPLLRPIFDESLKPGTRVVSHDWFMPGWNPVKKETLDDGTGVIHTLWLYEIGRQY